MELVLNGKTVSAEEGMTVLEAAKAAGIYIPSLCYHPYISPTGTCRICAVEVEGMRGLPCSCTLPATEGMVVRTETPRVQEFRRTTLECILSEHPKICLECHRRERCDPYDLCLHHVAVIDSCVTCPANGECELQDVAAHVGLEQVRLPSILRESEVKEDGIFFERDYSLCIRCGRCVRICHEVRGNKAIYFLVDEKGLSIGTPLNHSLQDSGCKFCGACVDICPTGALRDRLQRGLPEQVITTTCPYCGVGCQLKLETRGGKITRVTPDPDGPANHGQACVKGRFGIAEFVHDDNRLTRPLLKKNGKLVEVNWDEALDVVAKNLTKYPDDQVAAISSAKSTNEDNYVMQKFARAVLGTNNVDHCARLCHAPTVAGLAQSFGSGAMTNSIGDLSESACILSVGSNTTDSHPVIGMFVRQANHKGTKLIVANPLEIDLVRYADLWLQQRPGTNVPLLMGMMKVIVDEGLTDSSFIEQRCENFDAFKESLNNFPLDLVKRITGVPKDKIVAAARMYATNSPAAILYAMGITQHSHGTDNVMAVANLAMLTGNIGKPGSGVNPLRGQNNVQGACDMGALPNVYPGYQSVADPAVREKFEAAWECKLNPSPGLTLTEIIPAAYEGKIKAIYLMGENPVLSDPDASHVEEALKKLEFLVVQDIFLTETARLADVVLPSTSFAEKDGTFTNTERRVQRVRKAIAPISGSKPDWWIIRQLAQRMGGQGFDYEHPSQIMDEIARVTPSYGGISYQRLEGDGLQWPCPTGEHPGTPILHTEKFTRGKGKFIPLEYKPSMELPDDEYPLILTTERSLYHFHTGTMTRKVEGLNKLKKEEEVEINPGDAEALDIEDGEMVHVISRRGDVTAKAKVTDKSPAGVVSMTFHFAESPTNQLTSPALDPVAKIPELKVCAVQVEKISEATRV